MIKLQNICVTFSYKKVLNNLNYTFEDGVVYSLLGENGAGKSTLAHIICGDIHPTSGLLFTDDSEVHFDSPRESIIKGIGCVHQRPLLSDSISIEENLLLGTTENRKSINEKIKKYADQWLPGIKLKTKVGQLPLSQKFFVSLVGLLLKNPKTIILDEPTALLDQQQKDFLFTQIKKLSKDAKTIIFITHNFEEALEYSNKIILLKNGQIATEGPTQNYTKDNISKELFGGTFETSFIGEKIPNSTLIKARNLIHLEELENYIIHQNGKKRKEGLSFVPSNRTFVGSNPQLSIEQISTPYFTNYTSANLIAKCKEILLKAQVNIKPEEKAANLSGGMLQKIILYRELSTNPKLLVLCEPLQGLDYKSCNNLLSILKDQGDKGTKIIILTRSAFPEELCSNIISGTKEILKKQLEITE